MKKLVIGTLLVLALTGSAFAEVGLGADVVSRYIWRGIGLADDVSIQPMLSYSVGDLEVGSWASYAINGTGSNEVDLYASYAIGDFSIGVIDYTFPAAADPEDGKWGALDYGDPGPHILEVTLGYTSDDVPVSVFVAANVYNDEDNSLYAEFTYSVGPVDIFAGAIAGESAYYSTDGFALINVGISTSKDIKVTEDFTLPIFGSFILNPDRERAHLVIGFSL